MNLFPIAKHHFLLARRKELCEIAPSKSIGLTLSMACLLAKHKLTIGLDEMLGKVSLPCKEIVRA